MAEPAKVQKMKTEIVPGQLTVKGQIKNVLKHDTQNGTLFEYLILEPIPEGERYGFSNQIAFKSYSFLGNVGEETEVKCRVRSNGYKDKNGKQRYNSDLWEV